MIDGVLIKQEINSLSLRSNEITSSGMHLGLTASPAEYTVFCGYTVLKTEWEVFAIQFL